MGDESRGRSWVPDARWREAVAFLRGWLPPEAAEVYRRMIRDDPHGWYLHPHFSGGIIVDHALRGNGIDERALGVKDLNAVWPDLLQEAVAVDSAGDLASA